MIIGVLTGGGDAPGLNPAIRAVALTALAQGDQVIGFLDGWKGMQENNAISIDHAWTERIYDEGGTNLGTSRTNPMRSEDTMNAVVKNFQANRLDALIAIGGDDTLSVAAELSRRGLPVVGVPKTMDNDVPETDYCIGFDTAVNTVTESLDKLRTTHGDVRAIVLTASEEAGTLLDAVAAGAAGYLSKRSTGEELRQAVITAHAGGSVITPSLASHLLKEFSTSARGERSTVRPLQGRELDVLRLVVQGKTDNEIGKELFISPRTVQNHLTRIREKTGLRRRSELTRWAVEHNIV